MKIILLISYVRNTAIENRNNNIVDNMCLESKQNCIVQDYNYNNTGNTYSNYVDQNCDDGKCVGLSYVNNCGSCENQECKEKCRRKRNRDFDVMRLVKSINKSVVDYEAFNQIKTPPISFKTITISAPQKIQRTEPEPVIFIKTEIKTVTVDITGKTEC